MQDFIKITFYVVCLQVCLLFCFLTAHRQDHRYANQTSSETCMTKCMTPSMTLNTKCQKNVDKNLITKEILTNLSSSIELQFTYSTTIVCRHCRYDRIFFLLITNQDMFERVEIRLMNKINRLNKAKKEINE